MAEDDNETSITLDQGTCKEPGCKNRVGREHDYCHQHRD
jgi:hypothetical protein